MLRKIKFNSKSIIIQYFHFPLLFVSYSLVSIFQFCLIFVLFGFPVLCHAQPDRGSSYIVHIDFQRAFSQLDPSSHANRKFTQININGNRLSCGDASQGASRVFVNNSSTSNGDFNGWFKINDFVSDFAKTVEFYFRRFIILMDLILSF